MKLVLSLSCLLLFLSARVIEAQQNDEELGRFRITDKDKEIIGRLTEETMHFEESLREKLQPLDKEITFNSHVRQHGRFTFSNTASVDRGIANRRNVVEMTNAVMVKEVPAELVKPLVHLGFGPRSLCEGNCTCDKYTPYRTADGSCNNLKHAHWGKASIPFRRWVPPKYDNGVSSPRQTGAAGPLPSARFVSYKVHDESGTSDLNDEYTHMMMQWGQFLDHDMTSTPKQKGQYGGGSIGCCRSVFPNGQPPMSLLLKRPECFPIMMDPNTDPHFNTNCMNFVRSVQVPNSDCEVAPVEQMNQITAYIDASNVYGSSQDEQRELRTLMNGEMKVLEQTSSGKEFLPKDLPTSCNNPSVTNYCFKAGDKRCNENPTLQSMHTLFVWEHNRIAKILKKLNCHWDDEKIFQETRKIVGALMQKITYDEYLPIVLGGSVMSYYSLNTLSSGYSTDYNTHIDASIRNAFATAAFRFGHSMIRSNFSSLSTGYTSPMSDRLRDIFGDTSKILSDPDRDIDSYFRGLLFDKVQGVDKKLTTDVTQHLFPDGMISLDLAALNIQRGRDHGLDSYMEFRQFCGITSPLSSTHDAATLSLLNTVYGGSLQDIDLFTGLLTENPIPGGPLVGPTLACLLGLQFRALKLGDRFWFEGNDPNVRFTPAQLQQLRKASLSRVICDNTNIQTIQKNAFVKTTRVNCNLIDEMDLSAWKDPASTGTWGPWGFWGPCVNYVQTRTRKCSSCICGCVGLNSDSRACNLPCTWSPWSISVCNRSGIRSRRRTCSKTEYKYEKCFVELSDQPVSAQSFGTRGKK